MEEVITDIENLIKRKFEGEGTGHDWFHIDRVRRLALYLSSKEGGNKEVIELAALLHDISDHKFNGGDFQKGALVSESILAGYKIDSNIISQVKDIVSKISFKGNQVEDEKMSLEGKIVQDADRLDAIGAIGIARTFAYGGSKGNPIYLPDVPPGRHDTPESYLKDQSHTINHFYEKLLILESRMHTKTAKELARKRTKLMEEYLTEFIDEWNFVKE